VLWHHTVTHRVAWGIFPELYSPIIHVACCAFKRFSRLSPLCGHFVFIDLLEGDIYGSWQSDICPRYLLKVTGIGAKLRSLKMWMYYVECSVSVSVNRKLIVVCACVFVCVSTYNYAVFFMYRLWCGSVIFSDFQWSWSLGLNWRIKRYLLVEKLLRFEFCD
jgi:hypothetical protein